jgi:hypothetical protein
VQCGGWEGGERGHGLVGVSVLLNSSLHVGGLIALAGGNAFGAQLGYEWGPWLTCKQTNRPGRFVVIYSSPTFFWLGWLRSTASHGFSMASHGFSTASHGHVYIPLCIFRGVYPGQEGCVSFFFLVCDCEDSLTRRKATSSECRGAVHCRHKRAFHDKGVVGLDQFEAARPIKLRVVPSWAIRAAEPQRAMALERDTHTRTHTEREKEGERERALRGR